MSEHYKSIFERDHYKSLFERELSLRKSLQIELANVKENLRLVNAACARYKSRLKQARKRDLHDKHRKHFRTR